MSATTAKARKPLRPLKPFESRQYAVQQRQTLAWYTERPDSEGRLTGVVDWVDNDPHIQTTYEALCDRGYGSGAIHPSYYTLSIPCKVSERQMIRRVNIVETLGLVVVGRHRKRDDGGFDSNDYGLVHPLQTKALATVIALEKRDPETGLYYRVIAKPGVDVSQLPPYTPSARERVRPVVMREAAAAADTTPAEARIPVALPPWWAKSTMEQVGVRSLHLQSRVWGIYCHLRDTHQIRDPKHGKVIRGIARNQLYEEHWHQALEQQLLFGRSLSQEEELMARRGRMAQIAYRSLAKGMLVEQVRALCRTTSELADVRRVTEMEPWEADQAIAWAQQQLQQEQERLTQLVSAAVPEPVDTWIRATVQSLRANEARSSTPRSLTLDQLAPTLWQQRGAWNAPPEMTQAHIAQVMEMMRLQE